MATKRKVKKVAKVAPQSGRASAIDMLYAQMGELESQQSELESQISDIEDAISALDDAIRILEDIGH